MNSFETTISEFALSHGLLPDRGNVLVAVSGGADSIALLHALKRLKEAGDICCDFCIAHINHNLRGSESVEDERFVKRYAEKLGFQCMTRSVNVRGYAKKNKLSIETAARDLRIENLIEMAKLLDCPSIATAHHADDNAETVIYRMGRGTGFKGLCGINQKTAFTVNGCSATYIRPLLCVTKEDIIAYCKGNDIQWRHDHTNDEFDYARNRIRHLLIPYLQERCSKGIADLFSELSAGSQKLYERIESEIAIHKGELFLETAGDGISISSKVLQELSPIIQAEIIRLALVKVECGQKDITRKHYRQIISLLDGQGGKVIELPGGFTAKLELGEIIFYPPADTIDTTAIDVQKVEIKIPGIIKFGKFEIRAEILDAGDCDLQKFKADKTSNIEWFDMNKITGAIHARNRKSGDKFIPIGMNTEKKVGKFLTACQVDYHIRDNLIVIEDNEKIIWIGGVRASKQTLVSNSTNIILQVEIIPYSAFL